MCLFFQLSRFEPSDSELASSGVKGPDVATSHGMPRVALRLDDSGGVQSDHRVAHRGLPRFGGFRPGFVAPLPRSFAVWMLTLPTTNRGAIFCHGHSRGKDKRTPTSIQTPNPSV